MVIHLYYFMYRSNQMIAYCFEWPTFKLDSITTGLLNISRMDLSVKGYFRLRLCCAQPLMDSRLVFGFSNFRLWLRIYRFSVRRNCKVFRGFKRGFPLPGSYRIHCVRSDQVGFLKIDPIQIKRIK